jgi:formamidopyrimidine-DNA glycosylase
MPELPEVETIVRGLRGRLMGRTIRSVNVRTPAVIRGVGPRLLMRRLRGACVEGVERRGKYILLRLDNRVDVIIHLRMTGQLLFGADDWDRAADALTSALRATGDSPDKRRGDKSRIDRSASLPSRSPLVRDPYVRVVFHFDDGLRLLFRDVRRLGEIRLVADGDWGAVPGLRRLGPEPVGRGLSAERLARSFARRRAAVKSVLMDQRVVAGIGNIYASEILHAAGIDPRRPSAGLRRDEVERILRATRATLRRAIRRLGTTFRDFRGPEGAVGGYKPRVYGRAGEACPACRQEIRRVTIAGRSTYMCPRCQT